MFLSTGKIYFFAFEESGIQLHQDVLPRPLSFHSIESQEMRLAQFVYGKNRLAVRCDRETPDGTLHRGAGNDLFSLQIIIGVLSLEYGLIAASRSCMPVDCERNFA
jgi:hypothetical protein